MSRSRLMLAVWVLAGSGVLAPAGEGPVGRLSSTTAPEQVKAMAEIVATGDIYIAELESGYAKLGEDQRDLRYRYRDAAARIRTEQVRKWAVGICPSAGRKLDWDSVTHELSWEPRPATLDDARRVVCVVARNVADWPETEAVTLLKACLEDQSAAVREEAVAALDREAWKGPAAGLLAAAVNDRAEEVRAVAGVILLNRGDQRGVRAVLAGVLSTRPRVRDACTSAIPQLFVAEPDQPARPRFKHTADEVAALVKLLAVADLDIRGSAIRLLGMIGDKSVAPVLLGALGKEEIVRNRRRICSSLGLLRYRPAAGLLVKVVEGGLRREKEDHAWAVAASWAEIGDPDSVPAMIELLGNEQRAAYAAAGLSWAFGMAPGDDDELLRGAAPTQVLVPGSDGRLEMNSTTAAPKPKELQKLWQEFWGKNKDKFAWSDRASTLKAALAKPADGK